MKVSIFQATGRRGLFIGVALALPVILAVGCGPTRTSSSVQATGNDNSSNNQSEGVPNEVTKNDHQPQPGEDSVAGALNDPRDTVVDPSELESVSAEDALKGSTLGDTIITQPLEQFFLIQHRFILLNVDKALQLYEAEIGRRPRSHEEFMSEIIEKNSLELPELQPGWDYYYDATDGELKKRKVG